MSHFEASPENLGQDDEIELAEIFLLLRRHWRRIAAFAIVITVLSVIYVLLSVPRFSINGSLYLGDAKSTAPASQGDSGLNYLSDFQAVSDINTQVEIIKSKGLLEQAILETGLNAPVWSGGTPELDFWKWALIYGHRVEAYAPAPGDLQAADVTFFNQPRAPVSFYIIMGDHGHYKVVEFEGWFGSPVTLLAGVLGQPASGNGLSMVLNPAVAGAAPRPGTRFTMKVTSAQVMADSLLNDGLFTVMAGGVVMNPTKIANLQYLAQNPYMGAKFIDQVMQDFITTQISWNSQAASTTQDFISQQLDGIRAALTAADQKLAAYQAQTGILDVPDNATAVIGQLSQYETQKTSIELQQQALQQLNNEIAHPDGPLNPYLLSQTSDSVLSQLATSLATEEVKLQALNVQFTSNAPDVEIEQATIARIEEAIKNVIGNELASANANLANINAMIGRFNVRLRNMPAQSLQVISLTRASDVYGQIYVLLMQKEEEAEVSKAASIVDTRIISPAEIPIKATRPRAIICVTVGLFIGLFTGIAITLGQRAISGRFQSEDEIRRLAKLPIYGVIPLSTYAQMKSTPVFPAPQTPFTEAVRALRGNIYRSAAPQQCRAVLVTSAGIDDGKSTISVNLAKMLADGGKNVVLVDADLHLGRQHEALGCAASPGLTEWLVLMNRPKLQSVPGQRFTLLPTGILPPNPSELLHEPYLANVFAALRAEFDYVVIDSPPLPAVSDGLVLGEMADLVLSVAMVQHTSRRAFAMHNEMLNSMERRGLIINGVQNNAYGYGYYVRKENLMAKFLRVVERV